MNLDNVISPQSVAVLGGSNKQGSVGNAIMVNILQRRFTGKVYPINPSSDEVHFF